MVSRSGTTLGYAKVWKRLTVRTVGLGKTGQGNMEGDTDTEGVGAGEDATGDNALEVGNVLGTNGAVRDDDGVVLGADGLGEGAGRGEDDGDFEVAHLEEV